MNKLIAEYTTTNKYANSIWVFRKALYLFVLWYLIRYLPFLDEFYGPDSFIVKQHVFGNPLKWILLILNYDNNGIWYVLVYWLDVVLLTMALLGTKQQRGLAIAVYFLTCMLIFKSISITNAGEQLCYILLFFNMTLTTHNAKGIWVNTVSNFGLLGARTMLVFLYVIAGYSKLFGDHWLNGDAFYLVSQVPEYSHPWIQALLKGNMWISWLASGFTLLYQLTFPIAVWFRKIRYKWMVAGVAFHLAIGFFHNIMDFSLIMVVSYFLFYHDSKAERLKLNITSL